MFTVAFHWLFSFLPSLSLSCDILILSLSTNYIFSPTILPFETILHLSQFPFSLYNVCALPSPSSPTHPKHPLFPSSSPDTAWETVPQFHAADFNGIWLTGAIMECEIKSMSNRSQAANLSLEMLRRPQIEPEFSKTIWLSYHHV